ncbi:ftsX-like permease family protein, partial [Vibrio parahaemolyticus V-223/04]
CASIARVVRKQHFGLDCTGGYCSTICRIGRIKHRTDEVILPLCHQTGDEVGTEPDQPHAYNQRSAVWCAVAFFDAPFHYLACP